MLNSYVGSYNNTYSQAKINEVLHSISLEVSQWKQKNTQQQFGRIRYEGTVSNIANIEKLNFYNIYFGKHAFFVRLDYILKVLIRKKILYL